MKLPRILAFLAASLAAAIVLPAHEEHTELGEHMEKISGAFRRLKRQAPDASKNEDSLERVALIKAEAAAARKLTPALTAEKPEAERAEFVAGFRKGIGELLVHLDKVEAALKAGDNAAVVELVGRIDAFQKDSHKKFRKPEEEEEEEDEDEEEGHDH